jgi:hypothetical protein
MVRPEAGLGCFVVETAAELHTTDPEVHQWSEAAFDVTRKAMAALLRPGTLDDDLPGFLLRTILSAVPLAARTFATFAHRPVGTGRNTAGRTQLSFHDLVIQMCGNPFFKDQPQRSE